MGLVVEDDSFKSAKPHRFPAQEAGPGSHRLRLFAQTSAFEAEGSE